MPKCKSGALLMISADAGTSCSQSSIILVICGPSITGDLCPHRPLHAEFRVMSFWLKLGHTSSGGILLAKTPFVPAAVACLFGKALEFSFSFSFCRVDCVTYINFSLQEQSSKKQIPNEIATVVQPPKKL